MEFGKNMQAALFSIVGDVSPEQGQTITNDIIRQIGMTPIFEPKCWRYEDDLGWIGVQPLYESYVAWDQWDCHKGGFIVVVSCRPFFANIVQTVIESHGLKVHEQKHVGLSIP